MKNIKYIILSTFAALAVTSCETLDLEPKGILDDAALLGNEEGAKIYLAGIYNYLPIEDFNYSVSEGFRKGNHWDALKGFVGAICGEAIGWPWGVDGAEGFNNNNNENTRYWPYDRIRRINTFIEKLPDNKANFSETVYNSLWGEAHCLRAFYYFALAKRYGGVPLIDKVQDPTLPADTLNVFRATESATYRFIHNDLKIAMDNMPAKTEKGRIDRFVAAALMSRSMLYAGTIAKYGGYTTASPDEAAKRGYVGIPADEATWFFNESLNAANFFETQNGGYEIVGENADNKEQNFVDLFLKENAEDIFIKMYGTNAPFNMRLHHSWDGCTTPSGDFSSWPGSQMYPTLESVELFQKLPIEDADGKPIRYDERSDLQKGLEPRLLASVYFNGMELRGKTFDYRRGFYRSYTGTMADAQLGVTTAPINAESNRILATGRWLESEGLGRIAGNHGIWNGDIESNSGTGFYVRKYVDYNMSVAQAGGYGSAQSFKVFRYAEVLLNRAEAAYELGQKQDAVDCIARIRRRAGATAWTPKDAPAATYIVNNQTVDENLQFIRDERARELMFESHKWWDMKRWRVADKILSTHRPLGLMPYLVLDENKYIFVKEYNIYNKQFNFEVRWYYERISDGEMNKNPNLVQNPIY